MSEMGEDFKEMNRRTKEKHAKWYEKNTAVLEACDINYKYADYNCILIRDKDYPKASFYPHTGRWVAKGKTYGGGAEAFISWLNKRKAGGQK